MRKERVRQGTRGDHRPDGACMGFIVKYFCKLKVIEAKKIYFWLKKCSTEVA